MGFIKDAWNGITGKTAANTANKVGQMQSDSTKYAADLQNNQYEQTRQDQMPWMQAGQRALGGLENFVFGGSPVAYSGNQGLPQQTMPSTQPTAITNQTQALPKSWLDNNTIKRIVIGFGGKDAGSSFFKQFKHIANNEQPASSTAPSAAPNTPSPASTGPMGNAPTGAPMQFSDAMGQNMQRQYNSGAYTNGLDAQSFYQDPSYQWRKQQGMDNIQAQAAAGGGLFSGATLKALNDYNSNLASQEYGNAWQRNMAENQNRFNVDGNLRSQDYNIFNSERSRQYNEMANLAGVGQTAANNLATLGANNANNIGELNMQGANARANAYATASQAKATGMGNLINLGIKAAGMFF